MILLQTLTKQRTRLLPVKKSIKKTRPKPIPSETKTRLSLMPVKTRQRLLPVSTKTRTSRDQDKSKNNINIVLDKPETFPVKKNIYIIPRPFQIETKLRLRWFTVKNKTQINEDNTHTNQHQDKMKNHTIWDQEKTKTFTIQDQDQDPCHPKPGPDQYIYQSRPKLAEMKTRPRPLTKNNTRLNLIVIKTRQTHTNNNQDLYQLRKIQNLYQVRPRQGQELYQPRQAHDPYQLTRLRGILFSQDQCKTNSYTSWDQGKKCKLLSVKSNLRPKSIWTKSTIQAISLVFFFFSQKCFFW